MASIRFLLLCCLYFSLATAQPSTKDRRRELGVQDLPVCGLACLVESLPGLCAADDAPCMCESRELTVRMSACMQANCTMADGLTVAKVQATLCQYPHPDKKVEGIAELSIMLCIATVAVLLRLAARVLAGEFFVEDYMITVAILLTIPMFVPLLLSLDHGLGRHIYDLADANSLKKTLLNLYIAENTYIVTLTLIKISILTLYLRLFQLYRGFRISVIITMVATTLSSSIILVLTILSCRPVERFWDRDVRQGSCLEITKLAYANSGLAIIQDLVIITLPVLLVAGLEALTRRKKVYVAGMFGVGGLGCLATILRLNTLSGFGDSIDPTWDYVPVTYWTSIELAAGFVVSSMPAIRTLHRTLSRRYCLGGVGCGSRESPETPLVKEQNGDDDDVASAMLRVMRPGNVIVARGARAARAVGGSLGSVVDRVRAAGGGNRYQQVRWDSWSGAAVTYPADTYCHPAFEDAGEASDATGHTQSGSSSSKIRRQTRPYAKYHPRRHDVMRKEPRATVTQVGPPSPRRKSFRPSTTRRDRVTI